MEKKGGKSRNKRKLLKSEIGHEWQIIFVWNV